MAQELIEESRIYSGDSRFVFRSSYKEDSPLTNRAIAKAVSRHWQEIGITEQFTPHDLRRTLRTRLAEIGIDDVVAERVMGHKLQGMLAIYNRHGYDAEKRQALDRWAKRLKQIVGIEEPDRGNVIQFKRLVAG
jgi:integrase